MCTFFKKYIEERAKEEAVFIIENAATIRATALRKNVSKSTVHKDVTERLWIIDPVLAKQVKTVLEQNKAERHIRGGEATRKKYFYIA